ncbi:Uncharacterized protein DAT39_000007, partial [Clarias magur]
EKQADGQTDTQRREGGHQRENRRPFVARQTVFDVSARVKTHEELCCARPRAATANFIRAFHRFLISGIPAAQTCRAVRGNAGPPVNTSGSLCVQLSFSSRANMQQ